MENIIRKEVMANVWIQEHLYRWFAVPDHRIMD